MLRKQSFLRTYSEPKKFQVPEYQVSTNQLVEFVNPTTSEVIKKSVVTHHDMQLSDFTDVTDCAENYNVLALQDANIQLKPCPTFINASLDSLSEAVDPLYNEVLDDLDNITPDNTNTNISNIE